MRNPWGRLYKGLRVLMLTGLCLCSCIAPLYAAGKTLKATMANDLKYVDPFWTTAYVTRNHGYMIYDTLFALDANLQPQPQMVETWQVSSDGLTYTFTPRPGLKWHDGAPVPLRIVWPHSNAGGNVTAWGKRCWKPPKPSKSSTTVPSR
jgi:peptide/nickel transport system substrate-binding protein